MLGQKKSIRARFDQKNEWLEGDTILREFNRGGWIRYGNTGESAQEILTSGNLSKISRKANWRDGFCRGEMLEQSVANPLGIKKPGEKKRSRDWGSVHA